MVEISEIVDPNSLEAWLLEQPDPTEAAVAIAHRSAMRVLPLIWRVTATHVELTAMPFLRASLISGVRLLHATPDIKIAARAAAFAANAAANAAAARAATFAANAAAARAAATAYAAARAAAFAANAAAYAAFAANAAATAYATADAADDILWQVVRADCEEVAQGVDPLTKSLWRPDVPTTDALWTKLKILLQNQSQGSEATARGETGPDWSFWIDWYERALNGTETRWDMLKEIALIAPEIWEGDPATLMDRIYAIQAEYSIKATPYAEKISFNQDTHKWRSDPISQLPEARAEDFQDKITDAIALLPTEDSANAQYAGLRPDLDRLRAQTDRYAAQGRPVLLYDTAMAAVAMLDRRADVGDCPTPTQDPIIGQFRSEIIAAADDLRNFDPEVRHVVETRSLDKAGRADDAQKRILAEAAEELLPISEGSLAEGFKEDAAIMADPYASPLEVRQAIYRCASRVLRITTKVYKVPREALKETAAVSKDVAIIVTGSTAFAAAYKLVLWLFG